MMTLAKKTNKWHLQPLFSGIAIALASTTASATPLNLSDIPLFVTVALPPNVVLTLDDSLSMPSSAVPDSIEGNQATNRFKSAYYNSLYYNPNITYTPPPKYDGTTCNLTSNPSTCHPNVSFTAAPLNGFAASRGTPVNLSNNYWATASYSPQNTTQTNAGSPSGSSDRNYYATSTTVTPPPTNYSFTCTVNFDDQGGTDRIDIISGTGCSFSTINGHTGITVTVSGVTGTPDTNGSYTATYVSSTRITVGNRFATDRNGVANVTLKWSIPGTSSTSYTYPAYYYRFYSQLGVTKPSSCPVAAASQKNDDNCYIKANVAASEQQNFANWFSYYRTRNLATVSSTMRAFAKVDGITRVAWQGLTTCATFGTTCNGWTVTGDTVGLNKDNRIRRLNATLSNGKTHKQELYEWLSRFPTAGSTYTLKATERVGEYFRGTISITHPFADDPQIREFPLNPDGTSKTTYDACRRNVHVLMTDGGWCGGSSTAQQVSVGDKNSTAITVPLGPSNGSINTVNYSWTPTAPYRDGQANNLSDLAFYYWATDLQTGLTNNLFPLIKDTSGSTTVDNNNITLAQWLNPKNDPATWQHLNTYAVGLGLQSTLVSPYAAWGGSTFAGDYSKLALGTSCPSSPIDTDSMTTTGGTAYCWPYTKTTDNCPPTDTDQQKKTYDLWHAAISSRGKFFSSESPDDLVAAFNSILTEISNDNATSTSAAANSTSLQTGTVIYQAQFNPNNWSGHLYNYTVTSNGTVTDQNSDGKLDGNDANWDAATLIPPPTTRNIRTINGAVGVEFLWANLSASQQTALKTSATGVVGSDATGQDRLNWLRGDTSKEVRNGGSFRNRMETVLGDIINSDPMFSYTENFGYTGLPTTVTGQSTYAAFVAGKNLRPPMVYEGANDGMLHAFRADTANADSGKELFAYIPAAVYGKLSSLTETDYSHKFFVDGSPSVSDAYLSGWKTVLVGGLGKGGKAIYALDISNPTTFTDANVLWEYSGSTADTGSTGTTDADGMGLTYSQPQIARLNDGSWVAIFGNGYNSASERAFLYIVNLSTGALIKKIPTNTSTSNGLSTPKLYDSNNDKTIDFVYAGDLQGNLWKFDLSASAPTGWGLGNGGNPLFTARNSSNQVQAITAQPVIGGHPSGGVLVYFGTGSYLTNSDISNLTVQSFYAIWDKPLATSTVARSSLVQQSIIEEITSGTTKTIPGCTDDPLIAGNECIVTFDYDLRATSKNTVDYTSKFGWYIDLLPLNGVAAGERVIFSALLKYDRVIFLTAIPSADPCISGGTSWLMEMDAGTGGATGASSFDFNNDDKFDDKDKLPSSNTASGLKSKVGMVKATVWLDKEGTGTAVKDMSGSTSNIQTVKNKGGTPPAGPTGPGVVDRLDWLQIQ
jgi:type IV pilus assembly protein PilY1